MIVCNRYLWLLYVIAVLVSSLLEVSVSAAANNAKYNEALIQTEEIVEEFSSSEEIKKSFFLKDNEKGVEWNESLQNIIVPFPQLDMIKSVHFMNSKPLTLDLRNGRCYCDIDAKAQTAKRNDDSISNKIELRKVEFRCELEFKLMAGNNDALEDEGSLQFVGFGDNMAVIMSHRQLTRENSFGTTFTRSVEFCKSDITISNFKIVKSRIVSKYLAGLEEMVVQMIDEEVNARDIFCEQLSHAANILDAESGLVGHLPVYISRILSSDRSNNNDHDHGDDDHDDHDNDIDNRKKYEVEKLSPVHEENGKESADADLIASAIRENVPQVSTKLLNLITNLFPADGVTLLGSDGVPSLGSEGIPLLGSDGIPLLGSDESTFADAIGVGVPSLNSGESTFEESNNDENDYVSNHGDNEVNDDRNENSDLIDFRDLFLPVDEAIRLGGSGRTYSTLIETVFAIFKDRLLSTNENGDLNINDLLITPLTEVFSSTKGMVHVEGDLIYLNTDNMTAPFDVFPPVEFRLHDLKVRNIDILVPPISIFEPTAYDYTMENHLNFGPAPDGRKLNITIGAALNVTFPDTNVTIRNEMDIGFSGESFEAFIEIVSRMSLSKFLEFSIDSITDPTCWLTLMQLPVLDRDGFRVVENTALSRAEQQEEQQHGISIKSMVMRAAGDSRLFADCRYCTSRGAVVIPEILDMIHGIGVTRLMVRRLEVMVNELALSDTVQTEIDRILYLSPLSCPHSREHNISLAKEKQNEFLSAKFPKISSESIDTLVFSALYASEASFVVVAELLAELLLDKNDNYSEMYDRPIYVPPEDLNLIDFTDLGYDSLNVLFELGREMLGSTLKDRTTGREHPMIYEILRHMPLLDGSGVLRVDLQDFLILDVEGLMIRINYVNVTGLDKITRFDVAEPIGPQELRNVITFSNLTLALDFSIDHLLTEEPEQNFALTVDISDLNITASLIAAFDLDLYFSLNVGSVLIPENILGCMLSATHELQVSELIVGMSSINEISVDGLLPESGEVFQRFQRLILDKYGTSITRVLPAFMDVVILSMINEGMNAFRRETVCPQNQKVPTSKRFIDFIELFSVDGNYGIMPSYMKDAINIGLNIIDPVTDWPIINSYLIAPLTEYFSGEKGAIKSDGDLIAVSTDLSRFALPDLGLGNISARIFDASMKNLHSFVPPLELFEQNMTNGFLLDNRATLGARDRPVRFMMKSMFGMGDVYNELELKVEWREVSFFAVLLIMVGASELMSMELRNMLKIECLLSLLTVPEMDGALGLALNYFESDLLSSMEIDLSCMNCTSAGIMEVPLLFEKLKDVGTLDVLSYRIMGELVDTMMLPSVFGNSTIEGSLSDIIGEFSATLSESCPSGPRDPTVIGPTVAGTELFEQSILSIHSADTFLSQISFRLAPDTIETVVFAFCFLAKIAMVVVAESLSTDGLARRDPLWAQKELVVPQTVHLIDFTARESNEVINLFHLGVDMLNEMLTTAPILPSDSSTGDLGINSMIKQVLDENGVLSFEINDLVNNLTAVSGYNSSDAQFIRSMTLDLQFVNLTLSNIRITGLDSFSKIKLMNIIGPQTFLNEIGLKSIELDVDVLIDTGEDILSFSVSFGAKDIDASISMLVAIDEEKLGGFELGSALKISNILACLLSVLHDVKVTQLDVQVSSIDIFDVRGFQSSGLEEAAEELRSFIKEHYGDVLASSVSAIFDGPVVTLINYFLDDFLDNMPTCYGLESKPGAFVDLRDLLLSPLESIVYGGSGTCPYGDIISKAVELLRSIYEVSPNDELSDLNHLLFGPWDYTSLLNGTIANLGLPSLVSEKPGSFGVPGVIFEFNNDIYVSPAVTGLFSLRISDILLENVDTIGTPLSLLEVIMNEPYMLDNMASVGTGEQPLRISANIFLSLEFLGQDVKNEFIVNLDFHTITVALRTLSKILEQRLLGLPLRDVTNLDCWLATIPAHSLDSYGIRSKGVEASAAMVEILLSVAKMNLNINCISCGGPALEKFGEVLANPEAQDKLTEDVNFVLAYVSQQLGGDLLQDQIDRMLFDSSKRCPHSPAYDATFQEMDYEPFPNLETPILTNIDVIQMLLICTSILLMSVVAGFAVKWIVRRRGQRWLLSLPKNRLFLMKRQENMEMEMEATLNGSMSSLFCSPVVPKFARYFIPFTIVGNILMFLSGHLSLGGLVILNLDFFGVSARGGEMFVFALAPSMMELFTQGFIELGLVALFFSILWPYVKQMISLFFWFVPPKRASVFLRGRVYVWLDNFAKWSMMDIFVLVANVAGMWLTFETPDFAYLPEGLLGFSVLVTPRWGLYANLLAQLVSQISSHFIIYYHREALRSAKEEYELMYRSVEAPTEDSIESSHDENRDENKIFRSTEVPAADSIKYSRGENLDEKQMHICTEAPTEESIESSRERTVFDKRVHRSIEAPTIDSIESSHLENPDDIPYSGADDISIVKSQLTSSTGTKDLDFNQDGLDTKALLESFGDYSDDKNQNGAVIKGTSQSLSDYSDDKTSHQLCKFAFTRPHREESDKLVVHKSVNILLFLMCILIFVLVMIGSLLPSFSNQIYGVVGLAIAFGRQTEEAIDTYSIFSLTGTLTEMSKIAGSRHIVGVGLMSCLLVVTIMLVPLATTVALACQWFLPLTRASRQKLCFAIEILNAWQYADVYLFSMIIETWRQEQTTPLAFGAMCGPFQDVFAVLHYYGILSYTNAQCMQLETSLEIGAYFLVAGIGLLHFTSSYIMYATTQYFRETDPSYIRFHLEIQHSKEQQQQRQCSLPDHVEAKDVRRPPALFSDFYRWTLRKQDDEDISSGYEVVRDFQTYRFLKRKNVSSDDTSHPMSFEKSVKLPQFREYSHSSDDSFGKNVDC